GAAIEQKVTELVETGKLKYYDELKASIPPGLALMLEIPGVGPKKVKTLHDKLGVETIEQLEAACKSGKVAELAGFGEKTAQNIVMRQRASQRGLRLNEYGLFRSKEETRDPKLLEACQSEQDIFQKLGLPFIEPELREDMGEFAAAEKNELPKLVEWTQLR